MTKLLNLLFEDIIRMFPTWNKKQISLFYRLVNEFDNPDGSKISESDYINVSDLISAPLRNYMNTYDVVNLKSDDKKNDLSFWDTKHIQEKDVDTDLHTISKEILLKHGYRPRY